MADQTVGPNWVFAQIGRREHYVLPAMFARENRLARLYTDRWTSSGVFARGRHREDIPSRLVVAWNAAFGRFELSERLRRRPPSALAERRNALFDRLVAEHHNQNPTGDIVCTYSYGTPSLVRHHRGQVPIVVCQIDGGEAAERLLAEYGIVDYTHSSDYWRAWRQQLTAADAVVVNSGWTTQLLSGNDWLDPSQITEIPLCFDRPDRDHIRRPTRTVAINKNHPLRICFVGQFDRRKGADILLDALEGLSSYPLTLQVIGGGDRKLLQRAGALSSAKVIPPSPPSAVDDVLTSSDVFVLPTRSDGFAMTQLEAISAGVPGIVSTNCGAVYENGISGLILPELSVDSLSDALVSLLDVERLEGLAAQCRLEERFRAKSIRAQWDALALRLIN